MKNIEKMSYSEMSEELQSLIKRAKELDIALKKIDASAPRTTSSNDGNYTGNLILNH